jgi:hypothetical protein
LLACLLLIIENFQYLQKTGENIKKKTSYFYHPTATIFNSDELIPYKPKSPNPRLI